MPRSALTLLAAAVATLASALVAAQSETGRPPHTIKDVMTTMTVPASDIVFAAASDPPQDDGGWAALRRAAQMLADSGGLLMTPALARDNGAWMERAADMVKEAEAARRLAEAKNREALEAASDRVYAVCEACHARYLNQP
jgi:hypothetical protein